MSFTLNPAPFDSNVSFSSQKIKSTVELEKRIKKKANPVQISKLETMENDEDDSLENFEPIERPKLTNTGTRENNMLPKNSDTNISELSLEKSEINNFTSNPYLISEGIKEVKTQNTVNTSPTNHEKNINDVERKLNYLIKMMEQQKNTDVQYLTEEIILYGFFGVFIIYVVDSFTRVGKYVR